MPISYQNYQPAVIGSRDNLKRPLPDSFTGSLSYRQRRRSESPLSRRSFQEPILNRQDPQPQRPTSGRRIRPSLVQDSNLDPNYSSEMILKIGRLSEEWLEQGDLKILILTFTLEVISSCKESLLIMQNLLEWKENVLSTGGQLASASQEGPGMNVVYQLTLRIQTPNSGMVTRIMNMLSAMSFVESLTSPICLDGVTVIQFSLKLRAALGFYALRRSSSQATSTPENGMSGLTTQQSMLSLGGSSLSSSPNPGYQGMTHNTPNTPTPTSDRAIRIDAMVQGMRAYRTAYDAYYSGFSNM